MIANELRRYLLENVPQRHISEIRVGARYTAARLDDGGVGLAYTFREDPTAGLPPLGDRRLPAGEATADILAYLESEDGLERSIGLAVANALINRPGAGQHEADLLHVLSVGFMDRVALVGCSGPLVPPLQRRAGEVAVFQHNASRVEGARPPEEALQELPDCSVAVITSTALVYGDADELLKAASGCREVALVGASTPLLPPVLAPAGVTLLSGMTVVDGPGILQVVADGGGMDAFEERVRKMNMRHDSPY